MTNLEFIEKEIDAYKQLKEHAILNISDADDDELFELQERINFANERLPILQSIKNELEAWETVKPSIHHIKEQQCFVIHNMFQKNQYNAIKKGLKI